MVSVLAVGVGMDLNPWDWDWIGFCGPRVAIGLVWGVCILDWFWIGSGQEFALKPSSIRRFARCQILPFVPRAKQTFDEGF